MIPSGVVPEVTTIKSAGGWSSREAVCNVGEGSERLDPTLYLRILFMTKWVYHNSTTVRLQGSA